MTAVWGVGGVGRLCGCWSWVCFGPGRGELGQVWMCGAVCRRLGYGGKDGNSRLLMVGVGVCMSVGICMLGRVYDNACEFSLWTSLG